jgi:hypothetical protein
MTGRITWFASFGIAVKVALGLWSINYDWVTKFITAAVTVLSYPTWFLARRRTLEA